MRGGELDRFERRRWVNEQLHIRATSKFVSKYVLWPLVQKEYLRFKVVLPDEPPTRLTTAIDAHIEGCDKTFKFQPEVTLLHRRLKTLRELGRKESEDHAVQRSWNWKNEPRQVDAIASKGDVILGLEFLHSTQTREREQAYKGKDGTVRVIVKPSHGKHNADKTLPLVTRTSFAHKAVVDVDPFQLLDPQVAWLDQAAAIARKFSGYDADGIAQVPVLLIGNLKSEAMKRVWNDRAANFDMEFVGRWGDKFCHKIVLMDLQTQLRPLEVWHAVRANHVPLVALFLHAVKGKLWPRGPRIAYEGRHVTLKGAVRFDLRGQLMTVLVDVFIANGGVASRRLVETEMVTQGVCAVGEKGKLFPREPPLTRQEADEFIVSVGKAGFALMNNETIWLDAKRLRSFATHFLSFDLWVAFLESPLFRADRSMLVPSPVPLPRGSGMKLPVVRIVQDLTLPLDDPDRYTGIVLPASINPDGTDKFDLEPPRELPAAFPALPGQWVFDPAPWLSGWVGARTGSPWTPVEKDHLKWMMDAAGPGRVVEAWRQFATFWGRSIEDVRRYLSGCPTHISKRARR